MKKYFGGVLIWLFALALSVIVYTLLPISFTSLGKRVDDLFFIHHRTQAPSGHVVIVDIDERSLSALGQWPWERDTVAKLLQKISRGGAGVIGLDIVFAEADKTSPSYINQRAHLGLKNPINHDAILAKSLANTPTIGGYVFDMKRSTALANPPKIPAVIVEKYAQDPIPGKEVFYHAKGVIPNIAPLQKSIYSSGFFNILPDSSGMIRNAPLLMRYGESLYPSLDLEMVRVALGEPSIIIQYGAKGLESIQLGEHTIPLDAHGSMTIRFRGPAHSFPYVSAIDVINSVTSPNAFKDKFVLIGSSAAGLLDLRSIPLDNAIAGVEIHANIIDNILTGDFLSKPLWIVGVNGLIFLGIFTFSFFLFLALNAVWLPVATAALAFGSFFLVQWVLFEKNLMINTAFPFLALILALFSAGLVNYFFESKQKKMIRDTLSKKVSPAVAKELIKHANTDILRNREEEVTVFFSDIRNFTTLSEKIGSAHDLIHLLNRYVDPMTEIILSHRGTIDKFIGDAIMAYWNAPQKVEHHCDEAVQSALKQLEALHIMNQDNVRHALPTIDIGIGINTGKAIVGEVGSQGRSDFTVIGDSVNLAARLQDLNKTYGTTLIISESTKNGLRDNYILRELDRTRVRGKKEINRIYEVIGKGDPAPMLQSELFEYHAALEDYFSKNLLRAYERFSALIRTSPNRLYEFHLQRIKKELKNSQPYRFDKNSL
jgi:adenylate cyclase